MKNKGFTLVETMVVVLISTIIFAALFSLFLVGRNSWAIGNVYVELQQQARTGMNRIINELGQSRGSQVTLTACNLNNGCSQIEFQVPVADSNPVAGTIYDVNGNIKWGADDVLNAQITYLVQNSNLIRVTPEHIVVDPIGACCDGTTCSEKKQSLCTGSYKGAGSNCDINPCVAAVTGACCYPNKSCSDDIEQASCTANGGTPQGQGIKCSSNPCGSPPGGGCFLNTTPILMSDGLTKPIAKIKLGDEVLAFDAKTKTLMKDKVSQVFKHTADNYLIINGHIRVTPNHPVYSKGKWVDIGGLKIGDSLFNSQGKEVLIKQIKQVKQRVKVYNIEVNPYHTYFAAGILAHNKPPIGGEGSIPRGSYWAKLYRKFMGLASALAQTGQQERVIATDIQSVEFTGSPPLPAAPNIITIRITARKTALGRDLSVNLISSVTLRN